MEKQGSAFGISFDKFIVAPHKSALNRFVNAHGVIDAIMIQTPSREGMLAAHSGSLASMGAALDPPADAEPHQAVVREAITEPSGI